MSTAMEFVNIVDLVKVAGEMGTGAAAPAAHPQTLEILTVADVQQWLTQAQHANLTDAISQRGILLLEQLLLALIPKETSLLSNYPKSIQPRDMDTLSVVRTRRGDATHLCDRRQADSDSGFGTPACGNVSEQKPCGALGR